MKKIDLIQLREELNNGNMIFFTSGRVDVVNGKLEQVLDVYLADLVKVEVDGETRILDTGDCIKLATLSNFDELTKERNDLKSLLFNQQSDDVKFTKTNTSANANYSTSTKGINANE